MATLLERSRIETIKMQVMLWAAFYRANPHRFVEEYLNIHLRTFQKILINEMDKNFYFCYIAARGQGKSYLIAIFCCTRCILYPGTKIVLVSGTRGQATNILEKIKNEILPNAPLLGNELKELVINPQKAEATFKNGSTIKVVTARDTARGNRANILVIDEYRMVDKDTLDTVLRKFLTAPREPGYLHKPKYKHLAERNKEVYLSSAYFTSHISYQKFRDYANNLVNDKKKYFVCGLPYQLSINEGLLNADQVADEMAEAGFNTVHWTTEMEALWWGSDEDSFFDFNDISQNRKINYPWLPEKFNAMVGGFKRTQIPPKKPGEIRLLSADIALMSSKKYNNDASAVFVNSLMPTRSGRYINNIVYTESFEGTHTQDQALHLRRLFNEFACDYLVIDGRGVGAGVCDLLVRDIMDTEIGDILPGLSCKNNKEWADRCTIKGARKALWIINASAQFNSDCAMMLRDGFKSGRVRLLVSEYDGEALLRKNKSYGSLSEEDKLKVQMPYINTTLLISELINLKHEITNNGVRMYTTSSARKDRFSSLSYSVYVATQLEVELAKKKENSTAEHDFFLFRPPKIK